MQIDELFKIDILNWNTFNFQQIDNLCQTSINTNRNSEIHHLQMIFNRLITKIQPNNVSDIIFRILKQHQFYLFKYFFLMMIQQNIEQLSDKQVLCRMQMVLQEVIYELKNEDLNQNYVCYLNKVCELFIQISIVLIKENFQINFINLQKIQKMNQFQIFNILCLYQHFSQQLKTEDEGCYGLNKLQQNMYFNLIMIGKDILSLEEDDCLDQVLLMYIQVVTQNADKHSFIDFNQNECIFKQLIIKYYNFSNIQMKVWAIKLSIKIQKLAISGYDQNSGQAVNQYKCMFDQSYDGLLVTINNSLLDDDQLKLYIEYYEKQSEDQIHSIEIFQKQKLEIDQDYLALLQNIAYLVGQQLTFDVGECLNQQDISQKTKMGLVIITKISYCEEEMLNQTVSQFWENYFKVLKQKGTDLKHNEMIKEIMSKLFVHMIRKINYYILFDQQYQQSKNKIKNSFEEFQHQNLKSILSTIMDVNYDNSKEQLLFQVQIQINAIDVDYLKQLMLAFQIVQDKIQDEKYKMIILRHLLQLNEINEKSELKILLTKIIIFYLIGLKSYFKELKKQYWMYMVAIVDRLFVFIEKKDEFVYVFQYFCKNLSDLLNFKEPMSNKQMVEYMVDKYLEINEKLSVEKNGVMLKGMIEIMKNQDKELQIECVNKMTRQMQLYMDNQIGFEQYDLKSVLLQTLVLRKVSKYIMYDHEVFSDQMLFFMIKLYHNSNQDYQQIATNVIQFLNNLLCNQDRNYVKMIAFQLIFIVQRSKNQSYELMRLLNNVLNSKVLSQDNELISEKQNLVRVVVENMMIKQQMGLLDGNIWDEKKQEKIVLINSCFVLGYVNCMDIQMVSSLVQVLYQNMDQVDQSRKKQMFGLIGNVYKNYEKYSSMVQQQICMELSNKYIQVVFRYIFQQIKMIQQGGSMEWSGIKMVDGLELLKTVIEFFLEHLRLPYEQKVMIVVQMTQLMVMDLQINVNANYLSNILIQESKNDLNKFENSVLQYLELDINK